mmetsp:Transcript_17802/g.34774  ORF Transcript_17802/g.34774 Transcript_17802/m.34774 type:complete len:442 (+) Transcript_17802:100-1425(+)
MSELPVRLVCRGPTLKWKVSLLVWTAPRVTLEIDQGRQRVILALETRLLRCLASSNAQLVRWATKLHVPGYGCVPPVSKDVQVVAEKTAQNAHLLCKHHKWDRRLALPVELALSQTLLEQSTVKHAKLGAFKISSDKLSASLAVLERQLHRRVQCFARCVLSGHLQVVTVPNRAQIVKLEQHNPSKGNLVVTLARLAVILMRASKPVAFCAPLATLPTPLDWKVAASVPQAEDLKLPLALLSVWPVNLANLLSDQNKNNVNCALLAAIQTHLGQHLAFAAQLGLLVTKKDCLCAKNVILACLQVLNLNPSVPVAKPEHSLVFQDPLFVSAVKPGNMRLWMVPRCALIAQWDTTVLQIRRKFSICAQWAAMQTNLGLRTASTASQVNLPLMKARLSVRIVFQGKRVLKGRKNAWPAEWEPILRSTAFQLRAENVKKAGTTQD